MSAAREPDAVALSVVGVPPVKVCVDYEHGEWCYVWTARNAGRESLGPVADVHDVLRLIAWSLNTGGVR
ncbi:hypothetical protein AB0L06_19875 [Spirillospora sp. NPDC052269]